MYKYAVRLTVRSCRNRECCPVPNKSASDSELGPFAGFVIEAGPTPGRRQSRSGDWPASIAEWRIPCREARRADFTGIKGRSTMVVNLIIRSCRPRSFANQTGPRRSGTSGWADLFGTGQMLSGRRLRESLITARSPAVVISSPDLGVFAVAAEGILCTFPCVVGALPEQCLRRKPRTHLLVGAAFRN